MQFVRKISGFHKPSKANQEAFERAVREITESSDRLLRALEVPARRTEKGDMPARMPSPAVEG